MTTHRSPAPAQRRALAFVGGALVAAATLFFALPARAVGPSALEGRASPAEARLLSFLHAANRMEVRMGRLAEERGFSPAVRQYGAMLVRDHSRADRQVLTQASRLALDLPYVPNGITIEQKRLNRAHMAHLRELSGPAFDRMFMRIMVRDHRDAIHRVVEARPAIVDPQVLALVDNTLPVLRHHHAEARQILGGMVAGPR